MQHRREVEDLGVKDTVTTKYVGQNHIFADAIIVFSVTHHINTWQTG